MLWNSKWERYSPFPNTADVIYVLLNCSVLRDSKSQAHCVKHAPCLLHVCCSASFKRLNKKTDTRVFGSGLTEIFFLAFSLLFYGFFCFPVPSSTPEPKKKKKELRRCQYSGIALVLEGFTGTICLKEIRNIELHLEHCSKAESAGPAEVV